GAVNSGQLAADPKRRLPFQPARGRRPRLVQPPERSERCGELQPGDAVGGIGEVGLVGCAGRLRMAVAIEMAERLRIVSGKGPRIERAQAHTARAPVAPALRLARPSV